MIKWRAWRRRMIEQRLLVRSLSIGRKSHMTMNCPWKRALCLASALVFGFYPPIAAERQGKESAVSKPRAASSVANTLLQLNTRSRVETVKGSGQYQVVAKTIEWNGKKTAIIICDMWDQHWCKGASARVAEMAPRINEVIKRARQRGVLIIHSPSETMEFYKDTPQRL